MQLSFSDQLPTLFKKKMHQHPSERPLAFDKLKLVNEYFMT